VLRYSRMRAPPKTADRHPSPRELAAEPIRESAKEFRAHVNRALQLLGSSDPLDVHRARKQLKSARALLRLLRPAIGDIRYRRENETVRDAARQLSHARDAIVLIDTLEDLARRFKEDLPADAAESLRSALQRRHDAISGREVRSDRLAARRALRQSIERSKRWPLHGADRASILDGARATYRRGRRALDAARAEPSVENLHDWRKQVKYTWQQLQFFTPLASGHFGASADDFHQLSDYLGDDHDLAVLQDFVLEHRELEPSSAASVRQVIERRRAELEARAFAAGERLYDAKPREFLQRLRHRVHDWRGATGFSGDRPSPAAPAH
jgi:CHAD domain-containing protein